MENMELKIIVQKTDKGNIRIKFPDGGSYLLEDKPCNWGLISAFEVELKFKKTKQENDAT